MKIENEVIGEIAEVIESYVGIKLHISSITDFFAVDTKEKEIITRLNSTTKILLKVEHTYEDYMTLIAELGLEMSSEWKKHWIPKINEVYFYVDPSGEIYPDGVRKTGYLKTDIKRYENYNAFPTKELAEQASNVSKLDRLILLWQYANNCLFEPDWLDDIQCKYFIIYDSRDKNACYDYNFRQKSNKTYFEKREQVKAFIDMYEAEIKELMNIK